MQVVYVIQVEAQTLNYQVGNFYFVVSIFFFYNTSMQDYFRAYKNLLLFIGHTVIKIRACR